MNRIPGQIILRPTSDAGRIHAFGLLEVPKGFIPPELVLHMADMGDGLHLATLAEPLPADKVEAIAFRKLGDIGFDSEAWIFEGSQTKGSIYVRLLTIPASREGAEVLGFSGTFRLRGGALPALNILHEVSLNPAGLAFEILAAPVNYAPLLAEHFQNPADLIFGLPIWASASRPLAFAAPWPRGDPGRGPRAHAPGGVAGRRPARGAGGGARRPDGRSGGEPGPPGWPRRRERPHLPGLL